MKGVFAQCLAKKGGTIVFSLPIYIRRSFSLIFYSLSLFSLRFWGGYREPDLEYLLQHEKNEIKN